MIFYISKIELTFLLTIQTEEIYFHKKEENSYINNARKMDLISIVEYMETNNK